MQVSTALIESTGPERVVRLATGRGEKADRIAGDCNKIRIGLVIEKKNGGSGRSGGTILLFQKRNRVKPPS